LTEPAPLPPAKPSASPESAAADPAAAETAILSPKSPDAATQTPAPEYSSSKNLNATAIKLGPENALQPKDAEATVVLNRHPAEPDSTAQVETAKTVLEPTTVILQPPSLVSPDSRENTAQATATAEPNLNREQGPTARNAGETTLMSADVAAIAQKMEEMTAADATAVVPAAAETQLSAETATASLELSDEPIAEISVFHRLRPAVWDLPTIILFGGANATFSLTLLGRSTQEAFVASMSLLILGFLHAFCAAVPAVVTANELKLSGALRVLPFIFWNLIGWMPYSAIELGWSLTLLLWILCAPFMALALCLLPKRLAAWWAKYAAARAAAKAEKAAQATTTKKSDDDASEEKDGKDAVKRERTKSAPGLDET
jgi:hypothetical protein